MDQSLAFTTAIHDAQKSGGMWLAQHPFVQAVRMGSARCDEIERWVRRIYCTTRTYSEILQSLSPPPPAEHSLHARQDLDLLRQLGEALGVPRSDVARPYTPVVVC